MSPIENVPPAPQRRPLREDRRVTDIERRRIETGVASAALNDPFPGFSGLGAAVLGDVANIWEAQLAHSYTEALISAVAAGGSTGSFALELNGSPVLTLSLLAGEVRHAYTSVFSINPGDRLGGTVTAAGGQVAISVQLRETV